MFATSQPTRHQKRRYWAARKPSDESVTITQSLGIKTMPVDIFLAVTPKPNPSEAAASATTTSSHPTERGSVDSYHAELNGPRPTGTYWSRTKI